MAEWHVILFERPEKQFLLDHTVVFYLTSFLQSFVLEVQANTGRKYCDGELKLAY